MCSGEAQHLGASLSAEHVPPPFRRVGPGQPEPVESGVKASEVIYVGDQYQIDVLGANKAGMKGVLLDRGDYFEETTDCPRIMTLTQILKYL